MGRRASQRRPPGPGGREAILRGAGRVFSEKGFRGTTMHDIASAAGYTAPTLYAYFSGKEDILRSLVADFLTEMIDAFEDDRCSEGQSFEERLDGLLGRHQKVAEGHRDSFVFLLRLGAGSEALHLDEATDHQAYQRRMVRWMRDAQRDTGELQGVPAAVLALALTSLFEGFLSDWANHGARKPLDSLIRQVKALFLGGVRGLR